MEHHEWKAGRLAAFAAYLQQEERSPATISKYLHAVHTFGIWLQTQYDDCTVTRERVTAWKEHLCRSGQAPVTVNGALAALHSFFRFAGWQDCRVRYLKLQRRAFRDASRELDKTEYRRLVTAARVRGSRRLALVLETICSTGVRVSEVRYITVEAAQRGRADIAMKGKIRTVLIPGKLAEKLLRYAKKQGVSQGAVFRTGRGGALSRGQIWAEMKQLAKAAGVVANKVFPHNLRHLFARTLYKASPDIVRLADVLGHSSIETTRIYLITTGDEYARQLDRLGLIS